MIIWVVKVMNTTGNVRFGPNVLNKKMVKVGSFFATPPPRSLGRILPIGAI